MEGLLMCLRIMYLPALVLEEGIATGLEVPMVVMAALHSITEFQRPRK